MRGDGQVFKPQLVGLQSSPCRVGDSGCYREAGSFGLPVQNEVRATVRDAAFHGPGRRATARCSRGSRSLWGHRNIPTVSGALSLWGDQNCSRRLEICRRTGPRTGLQGFDCWAHSRARSTVSWRLWPWHSRHEALSRNIVLRSGREQQTCRAISTRAFLPKRAAFSALGGAGTPRTTCVDRCTLTGFVALTRRRCRVKGERCVTS